MYKMFFKKYTTCCWTCKAPAGRNNVTRVPKPLCVPKQLGSFTKLQP